MKKLLFPIFLILAAFAVVGCDEDDDDMVVVDTRPQPPQGVYTVTGDNAIYIFWNGPYERDIKEFVIKRSNEATQNYSEIGRRTADDNPNLDLIYYSPGFVDYTAGNSNTYWYAISSVDFAGHESDLSAEPAFDTPRPEGVVELWDMAVDGSEAGFDFANQDRVAWDSPAADVYVDKAGGIYYINAANVSTYIQDLGYCEYFENVGWAPQDGWSARGWMEVIQNHIYVIKTSDKHYAKLWVLAENAASLDLAWAYQRGYDNPELAPRSDGTDEIVVGPNYLKRNVSTGSSK
ncbi:MAG: hypothetical protein OEW00_06215 [candidate division Zixibacteria bacterium]|nr:hypothetical protein [candidate division Zixibacteria bacterium]